MDTFSSTRGQDLSEAPRVSLRIARLRQRTFLRSKKRGGALEERQLATFRLPFSASLRCNCRVESTKYRYGIFTYSYRCLSKKHLKLDLL